MCFLICDELLSTLLALSRFSYMYLDELNFHRCGLFTQKCSFHYGGSSSHNSILSIYPVYSVVPTEIVDRLIYDGFVEELVEVLECKEPDLMVWLLCWGGICFDNLRFYSSCGNCFCLVTIERGNRDHILIAMHHSF